MAELDLGLVVGPPGPKGDTGGPGPKGDQGDPGRGVPFGGLPGQLLTKSSDVDYETEWSWGAYDSFQKSLNALASEIVSGDVSAPLETRAGEVITTRDGEEIRAHRKLCGCANI